MTKLVLIAIIVLVGAGAISSYINEAPGSGQGPGKQARRDPPLRHNPRRSRRPDHIGDRAEDRGWRSPEGGRSKPPVWGSGSGRALRPASPRDPSVRINIKPRTGSSSGTAFSIDRRGLWMTARHVVDGCPKIYVLTAPRKGLLVRRVYVHPTADIAMISTSRGSPALTFAQSTLRLGMTGFHFGFPKGQPGAVQSALIGRRVMRVRGRYRTAEPVVAWAERVRVPNTGGGLGGISGGPALDRNGGVIGVTVAGTVRRGRVYTTAPVSIARAIRRAHMRLPTRGPSSTKRVPENGFPAYGSQLRHRLTVAKVICLVSRNRRRPRY
ncbi:MAG: serine protease [Alphaproteobacteria bacterium]|nr:serine protease [Alphaproteobacteria bacterium]